MTSAYADESFHEAPSGGFYVLAAAVFDGEDHDLSRETMLQLRAKEGRGKVPKLHWHNMNRHRRQERARVACLTRLVHELHGCDVQTLFMESRSRVLNLRATAQER